jgi:hypothetical protein
VRFRDNVNLVLLEALMEQGFSGTVAVIASGTEDERLLMRRGAGRVFHPYYDASDFAADEITQALFQARKSPKKRTRM